MRDRSQTAEASPVDWEPGLERLRGAYADRTLTECAHEFRRFAAWCATHGHQALPAAPETVAAAVDHYFEACTARTVEGRIWYLRRLHLALDLPDPTRSDEVKLAFRRGARTHGGRRRRARSRQATPLNRELKARLSAVCSDTLIGVRDRAMLSLGYDTLCRQSELMALRVEDLTRLEDGSARILVRRSKADPFGRGEYVYLSARGLADVQLWLDQARLRQGPILRGVYFKTRVGHRGLHTRNLIERLRFLAKQAGLPDEQVKALSGHSMRVGATHDLAVQGRTLPQIMRAGRWRNLDSVALYLRDAPINVWATQVGEVLPEDRHPAIGSLAPQGGAGVPVTTGSEP